MTRNGEVELAYEVFGPPTGTPLLLIMGNGCQLAMWPPDVLRMLVERGFMADDLVAARHPDRVRSATLQSVSPSTSIRLARPRLGTVLRTGRAMVKKSRNRDDEGEKWATVFRAAATPGAPGGRGALARGRPDLEGGPGHRRRDRGREVRAVSGHGSRPASTQWPRIMDEIEAVVARSDNVGHDPR